MVDDIFNGKNQSRKEREVILFLFNTFSIFSSFSFLISLTFLEENLFYTLFRFIMKTLEQKSEFTDFLGKKWKVNCIGCGIAKKVVNPPFGLIYETNNFVIHQDPLIPLRGFIIIASKHHISSINEMDRLVYEELSSLIYQTRKSLQTLGSIINITIIQEERSPHFHVWMFPWYEEIIKKKLNSIQNIRSIMKDIQKSRLQESEISKIQNNISILQNYFIKKNLL